jgi:hypothetical protein
MSVAMKIACSPSVSATRAVLHVEVDDRDARAGAHQILRDRRADQRGAAGDDRDFACQSCHGVSPGMIE